MVSIINLTTLASRAERFVLDPLDNPNEGAAFGALQYPLDIDRIDSGHFIMFHVNESVRGSGVLASNFKKGVVDFLSNPFAVGFAAFGGGVFAAAAAAGAAQVERDILNQTGAQRNIIGRGRERIERTRQAIAEAGASSEQLTRLEQLAIKTETVNTIILYMPEKITTAYGFEYQGESLKFAAAGLGFAEKIGDILSGGTTIGEAFKSDFIKGLGEELTLTFVTKLLDSIGSIAGINLGAAGALEKNRRKVVNPHMQFLFKAVNQRSFEYSFNFAPRSESETEVVDNIIRAFKFYSHPELLNSGIFHGYPAEFDIQYVSKEKGLDGVERFQENDWLNRIGRCYLTNVAVDYSGAGLFSTFRHVAREVPERFQGVTSTTRQGNPPTHITMTLTFSELETLNRTHIQEGF